MYNKCIQIHIYKCIHTHTCVCVCVCVFRGSLPVFCLSKVKKKFKLTSISTLEVYGNAEGQLKGVRTLWLRGRAACRVPFYRTFAPFW